MRLIKINHDPSGRQLAVFGVVWMLFFVLIGALLQGRGAQQPVVLIVWAMAVAVPAIGWISTGFLRIVYLTMTYLAFPIGFVVSHLLLATIYYAVLTPIGLMMRMFRYDPMNRSFDAKADSYWIARDTDRDVKQYFRQA